MDKKTMLGILVSLIDSVDKIAQGALHDVCGPLKDMCEKFGGPNDKEWLREFSKFLRKETCWVKKQCPFVVWKKIKLGTGLKTAESFRFAFGMVDCFVGELASDLLAIREFTVASEELEVELAEVSNTALGFPHGASIRQTYARAKELGLDLCPSEVGPQLRLQYDDQPKGKLVSIAMEPIGRYGGDQNIFYLDNDGQKLWLHGFDGRLATCRPGNEIWIFVRRRFE
jgi:hypothetical protein